MSDCIAAIQYQVENNNFVLVSGNNRIVIPFSEELKEFVNDAPCISLEVLSGLKDAWFPDAEFEEVKTATQEVTQDAT